MRVAETPSQTIGPFFPAALIAPGSDALTGPQTRGVRVTIEGRVVDGDGEPVNDAIIEIWQANVEGRYPQSDDSREKVADPHFRGFGRASTDDNGWFRFHTIKPGPVAGSAGAPQAPHINVSVFARGLLRRLVTRVYFPGEALNDTDPILNDVPADRRATIIARATDGPSGPTFRFDIVLQGDGETVFLDV